MGRKPVFITANDLQRLRKFLDDMRSCAREEEFLESLFDAIDGAVIVPSEQLSRQVVTLNSQVRVKDLDSGEETSIQLVFPGDEDFEHGKISVLSPVGAALIGCSAGDTAKWKIPTGIRRLGIEEITYQPESDGLY